MSLTTYAGIRTPLEGAFGATAPGNYLGRTGISGRLAPANAGRTKRYRRGVIDVAELPTRQVSLLQYAWHIDCDKSKYTTSEPRRKGLRISGCQDRGPVPSAP